MAKRPRYLTQSEISTIMNEPDSETDESDVSSLLFSDSDYSGDTEIDEDINVSDVLTSEDWKTDLKVFEWIDFSADSGLKIKDPHLLREEIDFFNLIFTDEIIAIITNETNKYSKYVFDKKVSQPLCRTA